MVWDAPRVFHTAQSQPSLPHWATPQFRPFAIRHDAAVRSCLATILHSAVAGLPMGQRGLGLAHASDLSAAAFLGSLQGASAAVASLNTVSDSVPREDPTVALAPDVLLAQIEDPSVRASVPSIADLRTPAYPLPPNTARRRCVLIVRPVGALFE
jgi:hypothetical protein